MLLLGVLGTVFGLLLSRSREAGPAGGLGPGVLKCRGWLADVAMNAHHFATIMLCQRLEFVFLSQ